MANRNADKSPDHPAGAAPPRNLITRALDFIEWSGNKLPDPAVLFVIGLLIVWVVSAILSPFEFSETIKGNEIKINIESQLTLTAFASFLQNMVNWFVEFPPLGIVLVAMLGVGVAEASGFINACLKSMLNFTPRSLLTPMLILVAIVSHTAADAGYVLVIPIGGVMFYAAGRHPLAGIAAGFAGVSGGFSANFIPSGIDPLLSGLTETGTQIVDANYAVNPLCNWFFTSASCLIIVLLGWFLTDKVVEPRLRGTEIDGDPEEMPHMPELTSRDRIGMWWGLISIVIGVVLLIVWAAPQNSALRASNGSLTSYSPKAPLMDAIVPLIFVFFIIPGIVHGYVSRTFKSHRDIIQGMTKSMETMAYYLVLVFFAALFIESFKISHLADLLAVKGGAAITQSGIPSWAVIICLILLTAGVNLFIGSASSKWTMLAPVFVPMLMYAGLSPELTQAAYRVGDSTTNIITPMMPYFPLVVVFCQRYVKQTGIGTLAAMMLPYSIVFLICWTLFLLAYWQLGLPMGIEAPYGFDIDSVTQSLPAAEVN